jgi:energy-coupling factor transporter ATP-binding protein EcfA2
MPKKNSKSESNLSIATGDIQDVSGEVNIAAGDISIYKGYTAEQVSVLLTQITTTFQPKPFDGRCPYKGLDVFEEEDADLFFGRERLVEDLVSRVKESRSVFITGPSGSGKSSLVRAGLIHTLKQGAIKNLHSERWLYETMKPGREPIKDLALAFSRLKSPDLADYFRAHANEMDVLNKCAESILSGRKDQRFVLFVDQFEEVFTQISQEEERLAILNMLSHAGTVENGRVIVLFAMRSDFLSNCATYPALNELLGQQFRQIGAMQPEELVSAIALPAKHVGLPIEDELIARIINDMKGEPGALPLMQFALKDLFDSQQEKGGVIALTLEDYLRHGGIHKSLERHADNSFAKLSEGEQELARSIFSGLIEIGRGTQDTRRTALFNELITASEKAEDVEAIVQKLADARLIITDEQAGKDTVTLAHEKLIDAWPWLKKLVNENRDVIALQNEIASDAKEWDDHQRDESYLYTGARLANAREQLDAKRLMLSGLAELFIEAGARAHADELDAARQQLVRLRRQLRSSALSGLFGGALGFIFFDLLLYTGAIPELFFLIFFLIQIVSIGSIAGFFLTLTVQLSTDAYDGPHTWLRYLVGSMGGMIAFATGLLSYMSNSYIGDSLLEIMPAAMLEGALWGAVIGLGTTNAYTLSGTRRVWPSVLGTALAAGLILLGVELKLSVLVNESWAEAPSPLRIFLAGALMPCCVMAAALIRRPDPEKRGES